MLLLLCTKASNAGVQQASLQLPPQTCRSCTCWRETSLQQHTTLIWLSKQTGEQAEEQRHMLRFLL